MAEGDPFEGWVDIVEAARELNIHPQSMRRLIKQNRVPARLYGGKYLIERDQLLMFKSNYDPQGRVESGRLGCCRGWCGNFSNLFLVSQSHLQKAGFELRHSFVVTCVGLHSS